MNIESTGFNMEEKVYTKTVKDAIIAPKNESTKPFAESRMMESAEFRELNEKIKIAAVYLERLDYYAEFIVIDPETGTIKYNRTDFAPIENLQAKQYQENFTDIIKQFTEDMEKKAE
ncbi:MAG: hypothetical protein AAB795_01080, partial [Patescibacteria group bacterium]